MKVVLVLIDTRSGSRDAGFAPVVARGLGYALSIGLFHGRMNWVLRLGLLAMTLVLSACESVPRRGQHFILQVTAVPTTRLQLQARPELALAVRRGVTLDEVRAGRLILAHCYVDRRPESPGLRFGAILLPASMPAIHGQVIRVAAEQADGRETSYNRFFGTYLGIAQAGSEDYFSQGSWSHMLRCGRLRANNVLRVAVVGTVARWDFTFAQAEVARDRGIGEDELAAGRIVMGTCATAVDSWRDWKVRLARGLAVHPGDYIEALAGAAEGGAETGPIALGLRRVHPPAQKDELKTQGRLRVRCLAPAVPL